MKPSFNQKYSADFSEECRKALENSFGQIPMPKSFNSAKGYVKVDPVYIVEVIHKTKLVNKREISKNKKDENRNFVIKIKTKIKLWKNRKSPNFSIFFKFLNIKRGKK